MNKYIGLFLFLFFFVNPSIAQDLTEPPDGFEWVEAAEVKAHLLKPKDWYYKKHKQGTTQGYFITKENIDKEGSYMTGFSMNVVFDIPRKKGVTPTEFAAVYIKRASNSGKIIKEVWAHSMGPFNSYGVVIENHDPKDGDFNTHHLVIGNDQTGTAYIVIFEAPTESWSSAWKDGQVILGKLMIESET